MSTNLDGLPNKALYTPREVASFFGVTPRTVYVWVETGRATFASEFMSHLMLPNGQTVERYLLPQIQDAKTKGQLPKLLTM